MTAKDVVITECPAAHAEFHEAVTEKGMQCPATWAIYSRAGENAEQLGLGPTEEDAWENSANRLAKRSVAKLAEPAARAAEAEKNDTMRDYLKEVYALIWNTWYAGSPNAIPATLDIRFENGTDGYDPDTHILHLFISDANRDEGLCDRDCGFDPLSNPATWKSWYIVLVHEMIHEYQYRALNDIANQAGQDLFDNPPKLWDGLGHGPGFYTAIADRAAYFNIADIVKFCQIL